jgi:dolichol-phosphate mannosyltransferase
MRVVNLIATYNEQENIGLMLGTLAKIGRENPRYQFETLVVDANSPDGTAQVVREYMGRDKSIKMLTGPKKGLGFDLLRGYRYAAGEMKADVIIPNDADFSFDPKHIPELLAKVEEGYDVVVASRHVDKGGTEGWSLFRKLNHWVANILFATYIAGIKEVKDHNGNFKAIRVRGVLDRVPLERLLENIKIRGFVIQTYILYELSKHTKKFVEIPVVFKFRSRGEAKIGKKYLKSYLRDTLEYMKLCILIRLERSQRFFKFAVVGFIGYLVNAFGLELFYRLGLGPGPAAALGAEFAIISNFTWNNLWTFAEKRITGFKSVIWKFLNFNLTSFGAVLIQAIVVGILARLFGDQWRQIYLIIAIGFFVIPYNYSMYNLFIWKTWKVPWIKK